MKGYIVKMYKEKNHDKMIDIYESDLEDYFKYLLERVNKFLNSRSESSEKLQSDHHVKVVQKKKAS